MSDDLKQKVKRFIREHALLRGGEHVLVAVSGGADSVALLNILRELSRPLHLRLTVAHLNHKIRGNSADKDAAFVKQLARRLHLDFALGRKNVPQLAGRLGISLEMAGRKARYDFFERTALARRCDVVATAHTADDSVESILIMLLRGCGLQGLTGIPPLAFAREPHALHGEEWRGDPSKLWDRGAKDGKAPASSAKEAPSFGRGASLSRTGKITVVRPLSGTDRQAIEKYLRERNLSWREDISNADPAFLRNRVRYELLPLLEAKYNKGIRQALRRLADVLRGENELLDALTAAIYAEAFETSEHALNCAIMAKYPLAARRRVLRHWMKANDINAGTLDFQTINKLDSLLMNPAGGRSMELAGGIIIRRNYQRLEIEKQRTKPIGNFYHKIRIPGRTILPEAGLIVRAKPGPGIDRERAEFGKFPVRASLSLKKLGQKQILVRPWRQGDRMNPYGLKGSKKVQDIFSDAKAPVALRHRLPIFVCGKEIIWIPGYRIAEGWQVLDSTVNALQLTVDWV